MSSLLIRRIALPAAGWRGRRARKIVEINEPLRFEPLVSVTVSRSCLSSEPAEPIDALGSLRRAMSPGICVVERWRAPHVHSCGGAGRLPG